MNKQQAAQTRIYPSLASQMLDSACRLHDRPVLSAYRIWLILRTLDQANTGHVPLDKLQQATQNTFGSRRLNDILKQGEGVFWTQNENKAGVLCVWLAGAARLAARLGVSRFAGKPVLIPTSSLYDTHTTFSAALIAAFDASGNGKPITRHKRQEILHRSPNTQRKYEKIAGTAVKKNFAILDHYTKHRLDMQRFGEQQPAFKLVDDNGRLGEPGQAYVAKQLASSYKPTQQHQAIESRSNKRLNKQLDRHSTDLCFMLDKGNGCNVSNEKFDKVYFDNEVDCLVGGASGYWMKADSMTSCVWMMS